MRSRHGNYHSMDWCPPLSKYYASGRFGRMFGNLPAFASDTPLIRDALEEIGKTGGIMDAEDVGDPKALITEPALRANNPDSRNPEMTAGMTFLGQFVDHDMTFDPTSSLERQVDPEQISNFRTPTLALDSVYGAGPLGSPHLYDQSSDGQGVKFLIEETGTPGKHDLPRNSQKVALIGDPRNDENLIVSQLHLAFLLFHNKVVDYLRQELGDSDSGAVFAEAQRLVRWHYQWILVHHFLRVTCGENVVSDVSLPEGRKFYTWQNEPFIPVEFSVAAYRFGHSQVRPSYRSNFTGASDGGALFLPLFKEGAVQDAPENDDLSGSKRETWRFIDWETFFDFGDGNVRRNKRIDTKLSTPLFTLPERNNQLSLAQRNLLRALTFSLPSGQRVARAMAEMMVGGASAKLKSDLLLDREAFDDLKQFKVGLEDHTPLWFYVLRESNVKTGGRRLGPIGARIVAEVFMGLMQGDKTSYFTQEPDWQPMLPTVDGDRQNEDFTMLDLLTFAGVGPVPVAAPAALAQPGETEGD